MSTPFEQLGIAPDASPKDIKRAYHAKLKQFPAHTHPQEFKAIRAAYDALRQGSTATVEDFFKRKPLEASFAPQTLATLREQATAAVQIDLKTLTRLTF
ncbi:J domain-containing protein [Leptothoe sp. PORK10 BA2]|uniref:J domain-containing protein n=1 Tax=Leptothoe sp. PORK10 BA2 TaxID=3110254 RepID=UPI002B219E5B|nr:J domain-containing protein [Leptothoe sp. PORK10 BA2]MEA5465081.1 J domain-containing protein [Leptothoe sp. PORK10 BA2]